MKDIDTVVCLHGIWGRGGSLFLLKRHLEREYGMQGLLFDYPSVKGSLDDNAAMLRDFLLDQLIARWPNGFNWLDIQGEPKQ